MRLSIVWGLIGLVGVASRAWGWSGGGEPVAARPSDLTAAVPAKWYADLPLEPESASDAYLARIPRAMRERGERYSDTRMRAFEFRLLCLILATIVLCATRLAARAHELAERVFSHRAPVDAAVALQYFVALYVLSLPVEIYATFVRPRRFGFSEQAFGAWLGDSLVNWAVFTAFYMVGVLVIYHFIRRRPTRWVASYLVAHHGSQCGIPGRPQRRVVHTGDHDGRIRIHRLRDACGHPAAGSTLAHVPVG